MDRISPDEWDKIIRNDDAVKKSFFELFKLTCLKCGSDKVEIFGDNDDGSCWYPGDRPDVKIVVKCHECGNAKVFDLNFVTREKIER